MADKNEELTQLTISSIPVTLVQEIEEMAESENRSRSAQTVELLKEIVAEKRPAEAAK